MSNRFIPVKIINCNEPWSEWTLEDGTVVRGRLVIKQIYIELDQDNQPIKNPDGSISYKWDMDIHSGAHEAAQGVRPINKNLN